MLEGTNQRVLGLYQRISLLTRVETRAPSKVEKDPAARPERRDLSPPLKQQ